MDYWQKARSFAEQAARRTQEITKEAAKRSQDLSIGSSKISDLVSETAKRSKEIASHASLRSQDFSKLSDIVSETTKCSKEIAAEASKRADQIKNEAIKMADQIKGLAVADPNTVTDKELHRFGITEELREFVKEITISTFQDFPLQDDSEMSNVPTVSNVRQDLSQFQEKHAKLVLLSVKEISKLRYELCPRSMKERKFWRIYFMLVNNHVAPYENQYIEDVGDESEELVKDKGEEQPKGEITPKHDLRNSKQLSKASSAEQDLDVFLLGGDSDDDEEDDGAPFDEDFNQMVDSSEDDEKEK